MYESCIEKFLKTYDHNHGERHSDSSDFENTNEIPIISPKNGTHRLLLDKSCLITTERDINTYQASKKNSYNNIKIKFHEKKLPLRKCRKKLLHTNDDEFIGKHQSDELNVGAKNNNKTRDDQSLLHLIEKLYSKTTIQNKVIPCLSTLFRRSYNCKNHMECIQEDRTHNISNCDNNCPYYKCQKSRKNRRGCRRNTVEPVYAVNENVNLFPLPNRIQQVSLSTDKSVLRNVDYELNFENSSIRSVSDNETFTPSRDKSIVQEVKQRLEKELRNYYDKKSISRNKYQQFPSKSQLRSPYQVFTTSSCQAEGASVESKGAHSLDCTTSSFWGFIADKLKYQAVKSEVMKPCYCIPTPSSLKSPPPKSPPLKSPPPKSPPPKSPPPKSSSPLLLPPCNPSTCKYKNSKNTINGSSPNLSSNDPCCCKLSSNSSNGSLNKKKTKESKVICKCSKNKPKKNSKTYNAQSMTEETKPCQEEHENVAHSLAQKYNGEILCIHNPPCVLINGCLNLPSLKSKEAGHFFPVTQIKKSSFSQMCRKIKRTKEKKSEKEQASQYHAPYGEIRKLLPEFGAEKIIQSVCYHVPPCEIVRGCYRAKYNPKLHNSCIHVPSCDKLPKCLLENKDKFQNNTCLHNPRCDELPLCSRKYIVLTAKADVCTQVKPKTKVLCRHEPPCFMIPKCLAYTICSDYIAVGAIPGCAHQPSCELIPACCRKSAKETVSVPSQYPNKSCRIV